VSDPRPPDEVLGYCAKGGEKDRLEPRARLLDLVRRVEREPALSA